MIHVIASIHVKGGEMARFVESFKSNVPKVLKEAGCMGYVLTIDFPSGLPPQDLDDNVATVIENWRSLEDLQAHLSAPHMIAYREKVKDLVDTMSMKVLKEA